MDTKKNSKSVVLIYILCLLAFGTTYFIKRRSIFDLLYMVVILCAIIKYLKAIRRK